MRHFSLFAYAHNDKEGSEKGSSLLFVYSISERT